MSFSLHSRLRQSRYFGVSHLYSLWSGRVNKATSTVPSKAEERVPEPWTLHLQSEGVRANSGSLLPPLTSIMATESKACFEFSKTQVEKFGRNAVSRMSTWSILSPF